MLVLTKPYQLYGRKVIVDVLSRKGAPGRNNTPYYGKEQIFTKYAGVNDVSDIILSLDYMFEDEDDFDADKVQPVQHFLDEFNSDEYEECERGEYLTPYSTMTDDPATFKTYYRRLEDINPEYINRYVGNITYRTLYQGNSTKSLANLKRLHVVQPTLVSVNDDDITEVSDLAVEERTGTYSDSEIDHANANLYYTLKRLHNLSKYMGVHMLSFIGAYLRAKEHNRRLRLSKGSVKTLSHNDVTAQGVYLCDAFGNAKNTPVAVKNKNVHVKEAFLWITGKSDNYKSYLKDYYDFIHYCEVLSIDISGDNMLHKIGDSVISQLVVKTVTPNRQYNEEIFRALKANDVTMYDIKAMSFADIIANTTSLVDEACCNQDSNNLLYNLAHNKTKHTLNDLRIEGQKLFINIARYKGEALDYTASNFTWQDGYLHYKGSLVVLEANLIYPALYLDNQFIISELGVCVRLTEGDRLFYMPTLSAYTNFENMLDTSPSDKRYTDWSVG